MRIFNSQLFLLGLFSLLFLQACSVKNTQQLAVPEQPQSIDELIQKSGLPLEIEPVTEIDNLPPEDPNDSWQYLISRFAIPEVNDELIRKQLDWYLSRPKYIETIQTRAEPYLYDIIKQVEAKGLPGEIALLPAVESGFKPHAYSRAHASGLWQFIPSTAKLYGLDQNWWYDGRRDVYAATEAATSYLQELGAAFEYDWLLALASYNAGLGTVSRAVKRNAHAGKATDFWSLNLPRETQNYVPKLLALAKIFAHAEEYGISLKSQTHQPTFMAVNIGSQLDLSTAARLSELSKEELLHLNPGLKQGYTPPEGPHRLLIPIHRVERFKQNLAQLPVDKRLQWHRHKISRGESLSTIARHYHTNVKVIRQVNHLKNNTIRAGAYLLIPSLAHKANASSVSTVAVIPKQQNSSYTVQKGDTLWNIARKYHVNSEELAYWNNIHVKAPLHIGQTLTIKNQAKSNIASADKKQTIFYTVRQGDSLYAISAKFNVSLADLRKWNVDTLGEYLQPGQKLTVKVETNQPAT